MEPKYKRILLKISGESFSGAQGFGLDPESIKNIAEDIKEVHDLGVEIGVVVGGGNFFRGRESKTLGIDRVYGNVSNNYKCTCITGRFRKTWSCNESTNRN
jgi:uridylate kinase